MYGFKFMAPHSTNTSFNMRSAEIQSLAQYHQKQNKTYSIINSTLQSLKLMVLNRRNYFGLQSGGK